MSSHCDRYVIVELDGSGHRFWYVSLVVQWLDRNAPWVDICLVTTEVAQHSPEWHGFIESKFPAGRIDVVLVEGPSTTVGAIATLMQERSARLVIPDGDRLLGRLVVATIMRRLRPRGSMVIMRPYRGPGIGAAVRHFAKKALMAAIVVLATNFTVLRLAPTGSPVPARGWVNDPIEFRPRTVGRLTWYGRFGLAWDQQYLIVLGDLSHRKFVLELVEAFDRRSVGNWRLVLVGRLGTDERRYFVSRLAPTRVSLVEGFMTDEDFDTWVAQADAVAVLHRNEGASGILGKCAVAGVPVLVGGAKSVLDSARLLDLRRSELQSVDAESICKALGSLPCLGTTVSHQPVRERSEDFASRLISG